MIVEKATEFQKEIAKKLGVEIKPDSFLVTAAILYDYIAEAIDEYWPEEATFNQIEFGESIDLDLSDDTIRTAKAKIKDELFRINRKAIDKYGVKEGSIIQFKNGDQIIEREISTLKKNGRIYFKGKNMKSFYASYINGANIKIKSIVGT